jgi:hypothetical protein
MKKNPQPREVPNPTDIDSVLNAFFSALPDAGINARNKKRLGIFLPNLQGKDQLVLDLTASIKKFAKKEWFTGLDCRFESC